MPLFHRILVVISLGVFVLGAHPSLGKNLEERDWVEIRTPNFRVLSTLDEKETADVARHLEATRVAIAIATMDSQVDSPIPLEVFVMRKSSDFEKAGVDSEGDGAYLPGLKKNRIVVRPSAHGAITHIISHHYAYFLLGDHRSSNYPPWFKAGFSSYLSNTEIRDDTAIFGLVSRRLFSAARSSLREALFSSSQADWLDTLSLENPEAWSNQGSYNDSGLTLDYAAQTYLLVHFLLGRDEREKLGDAMSRYVALVESGSSHPQALEQAFKIPEDGIRETLKRYIEGDFWPGFEIQVDDAIANLDLDPAVLSRKQISLALGDLALSQGALESARRWFTIASGDERILPRAAAGLGAVLEQNGDYREAQPHFKRAVTLAPADPYCHVDYADYWHLLARVTKDPGERTRYISLARKYYVNAWKLDQSIPAIYVGYGRTFLLEGTRYDKAIEMFETVESVLPASLQLRSLLAEAYMGSGRVADASEAANSVLAWSEPGSEVANAARKMLAELAVQSE